MNITDRLLKFFEKFQATPQGKKIIEQIESEEFEARAAKCRQLRELRAKRETVLPPLQAASRKAASDLEAFLKEQPKVEKKFREDAWNAEKTYMRTSQKLREEEQRLIEEIRAAAPPQLSAFSQEMRDDIEYTRRIPDAIKVEKFCPPPNINRAAAYTSMGHSKQVRIERAQAILREVNDAQIEPLTPQEIADRISRWRSSLPAVQRERFVLKNATDYQLVMAEPRVAVLG